MTALYYAAREGQSEAASLLISAGANIHWKNPRSGWTPAHVAAIMGRTETLKLLIDAGANLEVQDEDGQTPAQLAVQEGKTETLKFLAQSGHLKNNESGLVGAAAEENHFDTAVELMKSGVQFSKAELTMLFEKLYDLQNNHATEELIDFLETSLRKKKMKSRERQEKMTKILKSSSRTRPELQTALNNVDGRFAIGTGSFIVSSLIVIILAIIAVSFHGLDIYTDVEFSVSLLDKSARDQSLVKEELVKCTLKVDEEFIEIVNAFTDNGNMINSPDNEEFGKNQTEKIIKTGNSYSNCYNTENRFRSNPGEGRLSSIFSFAHICLPLVAAALIWAIIIRRQQVIGEKKEKENVPSCMWFTWNLPWLPFTKFYEAGLRIRSLYLDYNRKVDWSEEWVEYFENGYKRNKAELAVMREQNENTGKIFRVTETFLILTTQTFFSTIHLNIFFCKVNMGVMVELAFEATFQESIICCFKNC